MTYILNNTYQHISVMTEEVLRSLAIKPDGIYVDATFGHGGHSKAILDNLGEKGKVFAFDKDQDAVYCGKELFRDEKRFSIYHTSFVDIKNTLGEHKLLGQINGLLLDLGVSSRHLDNPERGFSFSKNGPLDMRMDQTKNISAQEWLNSAEQYDIAYVLKTYGEERLAKKIAQEIVRERTKNPLTTTKQLADICLKNMRFVRGKKHPATRVFQAIRIYINQELEELKDILEHILEILAIGGRLVVISFHSLEDRIVKHFMRDHSCRGSSADDMNEIKSNKFLKLVGKKCRSSSEEIAINPRARSAILRVAEKVIVC